MINTALIQEKYNVDASEYFKWHHTYKTAEDLYTREDTSFTFHVEDDYTERDYTIAVVFNKDPILPDQFVAEMIISLLYKDAMLEGRTLGDGKDDYEIEDWKIKLVFPTMSESNDAFQDIENALIEVGYRLRLKERTIS